MSEFAIRSSEILRGVVYYDMIADSLISWYNSQLVSVSARCGNLLGSPANATLWLLVRTTHPSTFKSESEEPFQETRPSRVGSNSRGRVRLHCPPHP
jgi:hypothetical protein